ncbi:MAG: arylesterase [Parcubacteria group bacterium]|nr:arylesterase [Parcubacteria group bacterium]
MRIRKIALYGLIGAGILLVLAAGSIYLFSDKTSSEMTCASQNLKIAAFGDSLVAGYGATQGNDLSALLAKEIGVPVINLGVSGNTTADALARISDVTDAKPDIATVLLGGNDALQKVPLATTKQNLATIIDILQKANIKVVLVGVMGGFPSDPYASMFKDLSSTYHVPLVTNILSGLFANSAYMSDEVHPNDAGYAKAAARIAPVIVSACAAK